MSATITCTRCGGLGTISGYAHISDGICFGCDGRGVTPAPKTAKATKKAAADAAYAAQVAANWDRFVADHPADAAVVDTFPGRVAALTRQHIGQTFYRTPGVSDPSATVRFCLRMFSR